jgi:hypothetical protein
VETNTESADKRCVQQKRSTVELILESADEHVVSSKKGVL